MGYRARIFENGQRLDFNDQLPEHESRWERTGKILQDRRRSEERLELDTGEGNFIPYICCHAEITRVQRAERQAFELERRKNNQSRTDVAGAFQGI